MLRNISVIACTDVASLDTPSSYSERNNGVRQFGQIKSSQTLGKKTHPRTWEVDSASSRTRRLRYLSCDIKLASTCGY